MTTIQRPETLAAVVGKHIRDAIVNGEYAPGAPLPEVRLAEQLGISRGTVREALRVLEDQGLVEVIPHRGSFVSRVTPRTAREIYSLRAVLEGYAVRLTIESGWFDDGGREVVERRLDELAEAAEGGDPIDTIEAERAFHRELWAHCGNEQLLAIMSTLQVQTRRLLIYNRHFESGDIPDVAQHRALAAAVFAADPDAAEALIRGHVHEAADRILEKLPTEGADG